MSLVQLEQWQCWREPGSSSFYWFRTTCWCWAHLAQSRIITLRWPLTLTWMKDWFPFQEVGVGSVLWSAGGSFGCGLWSEASSSRHAFVNVQLWTSDSSWTLYLLYSYSSWHRRLMTESCLLLLLWIKKKKKESGSHGRHRAPFLILKSNFYYFPHFCFMFRKMSKICAKSQTCLLQ